MGKVNRGIPNSAKAAKAAAKDDALLETRTSLVADPEDARLTLDGAVLLADGKIDVAAYGDLHSWFAGEPTPDQHPDPKRPGVRAGEDVPKGMRMWDDLRAGATTKDGAGWIASRARKNEPKKDKWFNIRTCGSWRLAFLLARLQRDLWEYRGGAIKAAQVGAGVAAGADTPKVTDPTKELTPQKVRPKAAATRKRKQPEPEKGADSQIAPQQQPEKKSALPSDVMAGSVRLQQILAARRAQEEQASQVQPLAAP